MTSTVLFLILLVTHGITIYKMNFTEPLMLKHLPWYPYTVQLIGPSVIAIVFLSLSYARNHGLRAAVLRETKKQLSCRLRRI